jgi:hypothetical protein
VKLSDIAREMDILLGSAHSIVHSQVEYKKVCACCVPNNLTDRHKACHM